MARNAIQRVYEKKIPNCVILVDVISSTLKLCVDSNDNGGSFMSLIFYKKISPLSIFFKQTPFMKAEMHRKKCRFLKRDITDLNLDKNIVNCS